MTVRVSGPNDGNIRVVIVSVCRPTYLYSATNPQSGTADLQTTQERVSGESEVSLRLFHRLPFGEREGTDATRVHCGNMMSGNSHINQCCELWKTKIYLRPGANITGLPIAPNRMRWSRGAGQTVIPISSTILNSS